MMKELPVYVLTVLFPFELMIMSGMGSGGAQLQMRHTENTVMKTKISLMFFFSHCNNLSRPTGSKVHGTQQKE